mmetsp:Transcript_4879/g.21762  ORF Transcript_4879/g.21762 Transcript_4879/m.21762 type:complete len:233 (-) Transcript_4879:3543-4241(-)
MTAERARSGSGSRSGSAARRFLEPAISSRAKRYPKITFPSIGSAGEQPGVESVVPALDQIRQRRRVGRARYRRRDGEIFRRVGAQSRSRARRRRRHLVAPMRASPHGRRSLEWTDQVQPGRRAQRVPQREIREKSRGATRGQTEAPHDGAERGGEVTAALLRSRYPLHLLELLANLLVLFVRRDRGADKSGAHRDGRAIGDVVTGEMRSQASIEPLPIRGCLFAAGSSRRMM